MTWNWQRPDWPAFTWEETSLQAAEQQFVLEGGKYFGIVKHLESQDQEQLTIEAIGIEVLTTSEIEGAILDRASVQSSIRKQLGLAADKRKIKPSEQGIAEMVVSVYHTFAEPLSSDMLYNWHRMLVKGRTDLKSVGSYCSDSEAMQIVSGALHQPKVHFEAPPSKRVPKEMSRFVDWFNRTGPNGKEPLPALTRAGIAHIYFESIHPFEAGQWAHWAGNF